ncbi:MAG: hypothetical protein IJV50_07565 [Lachnospiraceae bacterium]|nr:hypothetical protein [Lachnospiraceae bacterium]
MKNSSRKLWTLGIIGCICFGIGDWLLGYVDPGVIGEEFHVMRVGHGADYSLMKVTVTLFLGVIGMAFLIPGFRAQADILKDEKRKPLFRFFMTLCAVAWLVIHVTVSAGIFVYSWCMHQGDAVLAHDLAIDVMNLFQPMQLVSYVFLAVPLIMQILDIVRGRTVCKRTAVLFTSVVWMCVFSIFKFVFPASAFVNGLDTFSMNAGMIVWFIYLLLQVREDGLAEGR